MSMALAGTCLRLCLSALPDDILRPSATQGAKNNRGKEISESSNTPKREKKSLLAELLLTKYLPWSTTLVDGVCVSAQLIWQCINI